MLIHGMLMAMLLTGVDRPMTNQDVLELVSKGLSARLIVTMIENAETDFTTSTDAILALREHGVQDEVLQAMLQAEGPPGPGDDGSLMIYVSDSQSWEVSGGFVGFADGAGFGGSTGGGARPQTAEIIKTFRERCPDISVTNDRAKADYAVLLDHEGGKPFVLRDNKVAVFDRDGTAIHSGSTRSLGNAVKDACLAIHRAEARRNP